MILIVDANILVRCIVGRVAAKQAMAALERGVELVTTIAQMDEAVRVLVRVFGLDGGEAATELLHTSAVMRVVDEEEYEGVRDLARERLHAQAQPDWPVLAAALVMEAGIWTDDRDFFGVGVPIWSTPNLQFARAAA